MMPYFMDRHEFEQKLTPEEAAAAHSQDLHVQGKYGVRYLNYWLDYGGSRAFCLMEAPSADAAESVHRESHGVVANRIIEVDPKQFESFMGPIQEAEPGIPISNSAIRTILFTDIEGSVRLTQQLGDDEAMKLLRLHDQIIGDAIETYGGTRVKHTGDGVMASFFSVAKAAQAAVEIQRRLAERVSEFPVPVRVRVGLSAGEPVSENDDLFGAAVQLAARICAACEPGAIFAAAVVKELSIGKVLRWKPLGEKTLPGLDEPLLLWELVWQPQPETPSAPMGPS